MNRSPRILNRWSAIGFRALLILWASPWSSLGLTWGILALATGGHARRGPGILEFHGGAVSWGLEQLPGYVCAMTLGHVVVGRSAAALDVTQAHELVHVRQYERWGPFFIPAYFACSMACWCAGRDPYRDNPFEREAFDKAP